MDEDKQGSGIGGKSIWLMAGVALVGFLFLMLVALPLFTQSFASTSQQIAFSDLISRLKAGQVSQITERGQALDVTLTDGTKVVTQRESGGLLSESLRNYGVTPQDMANVKLTVEQPPNNAWLGMLIWLLPIVGIVALVWMSMRRQPSGDGISSQVGNITKSRARRVTVDRPRVAFDDVAGEEEAKQDLQEVVEYLRRPSKFLRVGARIPKGVLLVGPPGTGKTLLARAVAGEAGVPFFSISGSEFVEMFVGVGAARVRDLFDQAKKNPPCIVFIDEIDAVGRQRGSGIGQSNEEREQTLNQILSEMDGFDTNVSVIVLAATNRPDVLDPALLRPGRFDRRVTVDLPDVKGRLEILRVHARGKPLLSEDDLKRVARLTPGFSGAVLENVLNEAAILAARNGQSQITRSDLEAAVDRVMAGPERRSRRLSDVEREIAAYHEGGHALVAHFVGHADPVHKITIVSRGQAGGLTWLLPPEDHGFYSEPYLRDNLAYALGGMAAEQAVFGRVSSGSSNDLERATATAREMVSRFGMSEEVGPVSYGRSEQGLTPRGWVGGNDYSDETAAIIDQEVRRLIYDARDRARALLETHRDRLETIARRLLEVETLSGDALAEVLGPRSIPEPVPQLKPKPVPEPEPVPKKVPEPVPELRSEPVPEPKPKPETGAAPEAA